MFPLQGSAVSLQGAAPILQGSSPTIQGSSPHLQVTSNPMTIPISTGGVPLGATTDLTGGGTTGGTTTPTVDPEAAKRAALIDQLTGHTGDVQAAYDALFNDLNTLLQSRRDALNTQYDKQLKTASQNFTDVLPTIDQSFAALGSYDSTQRGDNRAKAEKGYQDTVSTIGDNKNKDLSALGQYGKESRAKFQADKESAQRYIDSAKNTTDVNALQSANNNLDTNLSQAKVTDATLGTDASAAKDLQGRTSDNGRFQAAMDALDSVIKSSMPSDVKAAAVTAVSNAAGLSEADKKKVQAQYGNVYAQQQAL